MRMLAITLLLCFVSAPVAAGHYYMTFDDGLPEKPNSTEYFTPTNSYGAISGVTQTETFYIDINNDGIPDRITRNRFVSPATPIGYTFYKIELQQKNRKYIDITPPGFRTAEGTECFTTVYKFGFLPKFSIGRISRGMGATEQTPQPVMITGYELILDQIVKASEFYYLPMCDVRDVARITTA